MVYGLRRFLLSIGFAIAVTGTIIRPASAQNYTPNVEWIDFSDDQPSFGSGGDTVDELIAMMEFMQKNSQRNNRAEVDFSEQLDDLDGLQQMMELMRIISQHNNDGERDVPKRPDPMPLRPDPVPHQPETRPQPTAPRNNASQYGNIVRSATWIRTESGSGSGTLVHFDERLVLTNYHVVGNSQFVKVNFAEFDGNRVISDIDHYTSKARTITGEVIAKVAGRDLAVVRLESVPQGARSMPFANESVQPGDDVCLVGNGGAVNALFGYTDGKVRAVNRQPLTYENGQQVNAVVVTSSMPINPGDSGAAIVNTRGELVGINMCYTKDAQLISRGTEVSEIRRFFSGN